MGIRLCKTNQLPTLVLFALHCSVQKQNNKEMWSCNPAFLNVMGKKDLAGFPLSESKSTHLVFKIIDVNCCFEKLCNVLQIKHGTGHDAFDNNYNPK